jgi:hypothetical protein
MYQLGPEEMKYFLGHVSAFSDTLRRLFLILILPYKDCNINPTDCDQIAMHLPDKLYAITLPQLSSSCSI